MVFIHCCAVMCADEKDITPYLLGQEQDTREWKFVLNLSGEQLNPFTAGQDLELVDLRSLMADLSVGDLAIAGHAVVKKRTSFSEHCDPVCARLMHCSRGCKLQVSS